MRRAMAWTDFWRKLFGSGAAEPASAAPVVAEQASAAPSAAEPAGAAAAGTSAASAASAASASDAESAVAPQGSPPLAPQAPYPVIPAAENPWGVDIVDVRPFTHTMVSASTDIRMAENSNLSAVDDGRGFLAETPLVDRVVDARLSYRVDGPLHDGVLFAPQAMEDKWHLSVHSGRLLVARSWTRKLHVDALVRVVDGVAEIGPLRGAIRSDDEPPELTVTLVDWLLRTHALGEAWPFPSPLPLDSPGETLGMLAFGVAGRRVAFVAADPVPHRAPERPLRTESLLHISAARGDSDGVVAALDAGVPIDLLGRDGLPALTWAMADPSRATFRLLLDRGCPPDVRSVQGATPLMNAVQSGDADLALALLDRGADPNARDHRGFTALHRAAELGHPEIVRLLRARGADPVAEAQGHTPRSLAEKRGHAAIVELLG